MTNTSSLCLVLGANGFIGSHLVDELVASGYRVRSFDHFSDKTASPKFHPSDQIEIMAGDIYDRRKLRESLKNVAYVFHCFSATTPLSSDNDPLTDIEKNLKPSIDIFKDCVTAGVQKVIFISSGGAVYGHLAEEKSARETDAATPVSPYGISKLAIENYLAYFNRKFGLNFITYRMTNPYGPRQQFKNSQGVIPAFLERIESQQPVIVFGDGGTSRDFVYIRDATQMIAQSFSKQTKYKTYNIGSGKQTTVNQVIEALRTHVDETFKVEHREEPKTFLRSAKISNERFTAEFGDLVATSLSDGIRTVLEQARKASV